MVNMFINILKICFVGFWIISSIFANEINLLSFPIPIEIDELSGKTVKSSLYIKVYVKDYDNVLIEEFKPVTQEEIAFKNFVIAVKNKNYAQCEKLLLKKDNLSNHQKYAKDIADLYYKAFDGFKDMRVISLFFIGQRRVFMWKFFSSWENKISARSLSFIEKDGEYVTDNGKFKDAVQDICTDIMQNVVENPDEYKGIKELKLNYEYEIPVGLIDSKTKAYPVYLQFNGETCDFNVLDKNVSITNPVLKFYKNAYEIFINEPPEKFAEFYTEKGKKDFKEYISSLTPALFSHEILKAKTKCIRFLLNAEPVYIIFYCHPDRRSEMKEAYFWHEYIIKDKKSNEFKLTNFAIGSFYDDLFKSDNLFQDPILKVLLIESDKKKDELKKK